MRERKRKLTEENVLQPFSFIIILFEKEKDFKQISSKGRDGPRGRANGRTDLNSTTTVKTFLFSLCVSMHSVKNDCNDHSIRFQYHRTK
jgi:hypothetical protein